MKVENLKELKRMSVKKLNNKQLSQVKGGLVIALQALRYNGGPDIRA